MKRLQQARKAKGLTLIQLQEESGVSYQYINALEKGRCVNPGRDIMLKLASALGCTLDDIFCEDTPISA